MVNLSPSAGNTGYLLHCYERQLEFPDQTQSFDRGNFLSSSQLFLKCQECQTLKPLKADTVLAGQMTLTPVTSHFIAFICFTKINGEILDL